MKILITGASSGIGRELAKQLVKDGHAVWGVARRENLLNDLKKELGDLFFYTAGDVSMENEALKIAEEMKRNNFSPDIVFLAAGVYLDRINKEFDYEIFRKTIDINLYGSLNFVQAFLPAFLERGAGQFIALSSVAALKPTFRSISYPPSKAALGIAFRGFDLIYRNKNIIFSTIYLGPVATEIWNARKSFIVASKKYTASAIKKVMRTNKSVYYIPFWSTLISRSGFLPDSWYAALIKLFQ